jgi:hypothetical protein
MVSSIAASGVFERRVLAESPPPPSVVRFGEWLGINNSSREY